MIMTSHTNPLGCGGGVNLYFPVSQMTHVHARRTILQRVDSEVRGSWCLGANRLFLGRSPCLAKIDPGWLFPCVVLLFGLEVRVYWSAKSQQRVKT